MTMAKGIVRWSNVPVSEQGFQRWPMVTGRPAFWPALINEMDAWAPPAQVTAPSKALHRPIVENGSPSDSPALMHIDAVGLHVAKRPKKFAPLGAVDLIGANVIRKLSSSKSSSRSEEVLLILSLRLPRVTSKDY
jgi:hypothetical protein